MKRETGGTELGSLDCWVVECVWGAGVQHILWDRRGEKSIQGWRRQMRGYQEMKSEISR